MGQTRLLTFSMTTGRVGHLPAVEMGGNRSDSRWHTCPVMCRTFTRTGTAVSRRCRWRSPYQAAAPSPRPTAVASRTSRRAVLPLPGLDTQLLTLTR